MITVESKPQQFQPAYNQYVFVLSSSEQTQPNYKTQIVVNDATDLNDIKQIYVGNYSPNPNGKVVADLSRVVRDIVSHDFDLGLTMVSNCANSIKRIQVTAQDYYGQIPAPTGTIVDIQDPANIEEYGAVWCAALPFETFATYNKNNYILTPLTFTQNKYLTNANVSKIKMSLNQNGYVHAIITNADGEDEYDLCEKIVIKTYNANNVLIGHYEIDSPAFDFDAYYRYMIRIPVGTYNIAQINNINITTITGTTPIITSNVSKYTVQIKRDNGQLSYPITVEIIEYCDTPKLFRLHWLNRKGGFDSFNFSRYYTESVNIQRTNYKKTFGGETNGNWGYSVSDIVNQNMINIYKRNYQIVSDWISEEESKWLEELLTSPIVYLEESPTVKKPVNITETGYEVKYKHKDKLINMIVNFEIANESYSQTY